MLVANNTLLKFVENWTTPETSIGAIARLKHLEEMTVSEDGRGSYMEPPVNWPSSGNVVCNSITACYQQGSPALHNVSLNIKAGQKSIVCGRTGSGKSTLLLTFLRLLELQSGSIELDGIDIRRVSLDRLRQRCFVTVSQNPFLLPNDTLRFNLDPSISVPDDVLITALTTVGLWLHFCNGTAHVSGTFSRLGEHPVSDQKLSLLRGLSAGQCQLLGVCRALVKTSSLRDSGVKAVVLLDEVTSSLDVATESAIHHTIDVEVLEKGHTVIVVAHRLGSLDEMKAGRDVVVVMADGRVRKVIDSDLVF